MGLQQVVVGANIITRVDDDKIGDRHLVDAEKKA